ncbi:MAG: hypothetical protein KC910_21845 [Candidatus Eremiobacteraeota bacterium]|nr:hypothetical protein [Candidatus Eremiobacteraeota bacterium]
MVRKADGVQPIALRRLTPPGVDHKPGPAAIDLRVESDPAPPACKPNWLARGALAGLAAAGALAGLSQAAEAAPAGASLSQPVSDSLSLPDPSFQVVPEGLTRVDLVRQTSEDSKGNKEDVPYSAFGIYLGHGLFHDTNNNLVLVPSLAFDESVAINDYSRLEARGPLGQDFDITRSQGRIEIDGPLWNNYTINESGSKATLRGAGLGGGYDFVHSGDRIEADGPLFADYTVRADGNRLHVQLPGFGGSFDITRSPDRIEVDGPLWNDTTITRRGDQIQVDGPGWNDYDLSRHGNRIEVDGPGWNDYTITYGQDEVHSDGPGWADHSYRLTH